MIGNAYFYNQYHSDSTISWIYLWVNSKDDVYFAMLFTHGNVGELQILCCQGFEVKHYDFTFDVLTLKFSGVCNVGVS